MTPPPSPASAAAALHDDRPRVPRPAGDRHLAGVRAPRGPRAPLGLNPTAPATRPFAHLKRSYD